MISEWCCSHGWSCLCQWATDQKGEHASPCCSVGEEVVVCTQMAYSHTTVVSCSRYIQHGPHRSSVGKPTLEQQISQTATLNTTALFCSNGIQSTHTANNRNKGCPRLATKNSFHASKLSGSKLRYARTQQHNGDEWGVPEGLVLWTNCHP